MSDVDVHLTLQWFYRFMPGKTKTWIDLEAAAAVAAGRKRRIARPRLVMELRYTCKLHRLSSASPLAPGWLLVRRIPTGLGASAFFPLLANLGLEEFNGPGFPWTVRVRSNRWHWFHEFDEWVYTSILSSEIQLGNQYQYLLNNPTYFSSIN